VIIPTQSDDRSAATAQTLAWIAAGLGLLHAAFSIYWGLGGTWLLDTIGGALEAGARAGDPLVGALVWAAVAMKLIAVIAGLLAVAPKSRGRPRWLARFVAWAAAIILTLYGGVLTITGLLVQTGIIPAAADADHWALAWHTFLWDPWFLLWGLVLGAALWRSRD
jgi:hypothetical protein